MPFKKKPTPKKKAASKKKAAPQKGAGKPVGIPVFSLAFAKVLHGNNFSTDGKFTVHCNEDGKIPSDKPDGNYDSLDDANDAAAQHKHDHPTHKLTVTAIQTH